MIFAVVFYFSMSSVSALIFTVSFLLPHLSQVSWGSLDFLSEVSPHFWWSVRCCALSSWHCFSCILRLTLWQECFSITLGQQQPESLLARWTKNTLGDLCISTPPESQTDSLTHCKDNSRAPFHQHTQMAVKLKHEPGKQNTLPA